MTIDKYTYKNKSLTTQALVGYGTVSPGKTIETAVAIHNPNFILVGGGRMVNVEAPTKQPKVDTKKGKQ